MGWVACAGSQPRDRQKEAGPPKLGRNFSPNLWPDTTRQALLLLLPPPLRAPPPFLVAPKPRCASRDSCFLVKSVTFLDFCCSIGAYTNAVKLVYILRISSCFLSSSSSSSEFALLSPPPPLSSFRA